MRSWEGSLAGHYQLETTTIATCFRFTLRRHPNYVQDAANGIGISDSFPYVSFKYAGMEEGDVFRIVDAGGTTEVNGKYYVVGSNVAGNVYMMNQYTDDGRIIRASTSTYTAHTGGGEIQKTYGLTNVDVDVYASGVRFYSDVGFLPATIRHLTNMKISNSEVQGVYSSAIRIDKDDIIYGRWDNAEYEIFEVNYASVTQGKLITGFGSLGDLQMRRNHYTAEFKSISDVLKQENMRVLTADCPFVVGDAKCNADIASALVSGTVASTTSRKEFTDTSRSEDEAWFQDGIFTFTNGENAGISYHIKSYSSTGVFELYDSVLHAIVSGTAYEATPGCDKSSQGDHGCKTKWDNMDNFGGFDFVIGRKAVTEHGTYGA